MGKYELKTTYIPTENSTNKFLKLTHIRKRLE